MDYKEHKVKEHLILLPYSVNSTDTMVDYIKNNINNLEDLTLINYIQIPSVYKEIFEYYELNIIIRLIPLIKLIDDEYIDFVVSIINNKDIKVRYNCYNIDVKILCKILTSCKMLYYHSSENRFYITKSKLPHYNGGHTYEKIYYISFKNPEKDIDKFIYQYPNLEYNFIIQNLPYHPEYYGVAEYTYKLKEELKQRNLKFNQIEVESIQPNIEYINVNRPLWKRIISKIIGIK